MNIEIKSMHFTLDEEQKDSILKKIERIRNADNMIVDFLLTVSKDASEYVAETTLNFKWGVQAFVKESAYDALAAVDKMFDSLHTKITKEKEKAEQRRR